jgi:hypothetical protein
MSPGRRQFIPPLVALSGVAAAFTVAIVTLAGTAAARRSPF